MVMTHLLSAPAKINLTLGVLGPREDGFHELRSVVIGVGLYDRVGCELRTTPGVDMVCNDPSLENENNLAARAANLLALKCDVEPAVAIELEKNIPIAAGLGGGSSDAAATLRLCDKLWLTGRSTKELAEIGAELGSDVPLFFSLPVAKFSGRGEVVESIELAWSGWVLLVIVDEAVSTPEVFSKWQPQDSPPRDDIDERICGAGSAREIGSLMYNDLESAVFRVAPRVQQAYERVIEIGCGPVRVSGAGSTMFRLFDDAEEARLIAKKIQQQCASVRTQVVEAPVGLDTVLSKND